MKKHTQTQPPPLTNYDYMHEMQRSFKMPLMLSYEESIPAEERIEMLRRWRDERTRFLFENCHDMDYVHDPQLLQLRKCIRDIKQNIELYM